MKGLDDQAKSNMHQANNAYTMSSKELLTKYFHQCPPFPPKQTFIKAIKNNQLTTWPDLTSKAVEKYLPHRVPATDNDHTTRHKKGT